MKHYFKSHEWIEALDEKTFRLGVSKYAADQLGDIVFLEQKDAGDDFEKGNSVAILESVKAVGDIYAPFDCSVKANNELLVDAPETINKDPEGTWVVEISSKETVDPSSLEGAMSKDDYESSYLASL